MRVWDVNSRVFDGLRALAWRPYLAAMWILCGELQSMYREWLRDPEEPLMASTLELVREVVNGGESHEAVQRANELTDRWDPVRKARDPESSGGLMNARMTFEGLAWEIADLTGKYYAADWVTGAVAERWRVRDPDDRGPWREDPDEEVDDTSSLAQALTLFERVVATVTEEPGPDWDPVRLRTQIFA